MNRSPLEVTQKYIAIFISILNIFTVNVRIFVRIYCSIDPVVLIIRTFPDQCSTYLDNYISFDKFCPSDLWGGNSLYSNVSKRMLSLTRTACTVNTTIRLCWFVACKTEWRRRYIIFCSSGGRESESLRLRFVNLIRCFSPWPVRLTVFLTVLFTIIFAKRVVRDLRRMKN